MIWGYYCSPLTYAYIALAADEMHSPRWMDKFVSLTLDHTSVVFSPENNFLDLLVMNQQAPDGRRLGVAVLENAGIFTNKEWYWIATGALLGFTILFNVLFTLSLMYLNRKYLLFTHKEYVKACIRQLLYFLNQAIFLVYDK